MTDVFFTISLIFTVWMCFDAINRKEHFIWILLMLVLSYPVPIGALAYFFTIKNKTPGKAIPPVKLFQSSPPKEVETEETLQLKEMIEKFHKPYHYEKLGSLFLEKGQLDQAIPPLEEAIKKDPELTEARYGLAKALHGLGRHSEAAEVLEELVKIDKKYDYGNAIFGLAECYRLSGQEDKALETYEAVINSYHFFKAYYHYARLLDKRGKKQEAISYMKSIIGSSKDLPEYKLEKERHWIEEAYKFLRKNGIELA
jgi:tetratricopeptide (TPR) repeat protein